MGEKGVTDVPSFLSASDPRRRSFLGLLAGLPVLACTPTSPLPQQDGATNMYGLIGKITAAAGQGDALAEILLEGLKDMPGSLSYIVAKDPAAADILWVTEVWTDQAAHAASLSLPSVQQAIAKGRPLIAGMERIAETEPLGGQGLAPV